MHSTGFCVPCTVAGVLVAAGDLPERRSACGRRSSGPLPPVAHRVPAGLVLPVVVAAAEHQPLLGPDDLAADREAAGLQALGDGRRRAARRARRRRRRRGTAPRPRASRRGRRSAPCRCAWLPRARRCCARRVVAHAVGRIGDHQVRPHAAEQARHVGRRRWRCRRAADAARAARGRPACETGTAGGSGVSSSRGSGVG